MNVRWLVLAAAVVVCAGCKGAARDTSVQDASVKDASVKDGAEIRALEDRFAAAVKAKDVNAIMALYVPDQSLIAYDVVPPLQYTGADAYRKDWQDTFAGSPGPVDFSVGGLEVVTGGNVAYSYSIQHATFTDKDGKKTELTVRVTDGYKKVNGHWLIAHEHASIPVDLATMKGEAEAK
ncbi:MAG: SgcJ/EcaC family oxidoreductase [Acidobacteriaceae bacterium]|jgi:uncharacterized protein (TIGR02246 family)